MESEMQTPIIMYGYEIIIPSSFHTFVNSMYDINDLLEKPYSVDVSRKIIKISGLLESFNFFDWTNFENFTLLCDFLSLVCFSVP